MIFKVAGRLAMPLILAVLLAGKPALSSEEMKIQALNKLELANNIPQSPLPVASVTSENNTLENTPDLQCYEIGPVVKEEAAKALLDDLRDGVKRLSMREEKHVDIQDYVVLSKKQNDRASLLKLKARYENAGIKNIHVMGAGNTIFASRISLGAFSVRANADSHQARLAKLGFDLVVVPRQKERSDYWLDLALIASTENTNTVNEVVKHFSANAAVSPVACESKSSTPLLDAQRVLLAGKPALSSDEMYVDDEAQIRPLLASKSLCEKGLDCAFEHWYVGANVGYASGDMATSDVQMAAAELGFDVFDIEVDDSRTAAKVLLGTSLSERFSLELGYTDLGDVSAAFSAITNRPDAFFELTNQIHPTSVKGVNASVNYHFWRHQDWYLNARLGLYKWKGDYDAIDVFGARVINQTTEQKGTDLFYGFGFNYRINERFQLDVEWDRYRVADENVDLLSLGFIYFFDGDERE